MIKRFSQALISVSIPTLFAACGGGSSDDVTCASFRYQEDAQANYQPKLDRDNDGIACEDLPRRPTTTNPNPTTPTTPAPSPTVVRTISFTDNLARQPVVQAMSDSSYRFSVSAFYQPVGESAQTAATTAAGVTTLSPSRFTYFAALPDTYISYFTQGSLVSEGIGFRTQSTVTLSALSGDYHLIGRKCENDSSDRCELLYGAARITANGNFAFCPQNGYSESCGGKIGSQISNTSSTSGKFAFSPSGTFFGGINASSTPQYGITVYLNIGTSVYSFFGQLASYTAVFNSASYRVARVTPTGYIEETISYPLITANSPIVGFSVSQSGSIFLRSTSGLVFIGTPKTSTTSASLKLQKIQ